jgi:hypothetical protein
VSNRVLKIVMGNYGATWMKRQLAYRAVRMFGWYLNIESKTGIKKPYTDIDTDTLYIVEPTTEQSGSDNELSKIFIIEVLDQNGLLDIFDRFINADTKIRMFWNAATVIEKTHPLLTEAIEQFKSELDLDNQQIGDLLTSLGLNY